jgi:WRKY transcription factor 2
MVADPTPSPKNSHVMLNEKFSSGSISGLFIEHGTNKPHDQSEKAEKL